MSESRRRLVVGAVAALLTVLVALRVPVLTQVSGLLLCATMGGAAWLRLRAFGVVDTIPRLAGAVVAVPAAIMASGLLLSATRVGIRPESVAPCLLLATVIVLAVGPRDERSPRESPRFRWSAVSPGAFALGVAAVLVLSGAFVVSARSYLAWEKDFTFSALAATSDAEGRLVVEVENHLGTDRPYRVTVTAPGSGETLLARDLSVPDGESRTVETDLPVTGPMTVQLYLADGAEPVRTLVVDRGVTQGGGR